MKKLFSLLICTVILVNVLPPVNAEESVPTVRDRLASGEYVEAPSAKTVDEDDPDAEIVYIDVSPEEWGETYINDPAFINRSDKTIFRFRNTISPKAICYKCGKASMTLKEDWDEVMGPIPITCPGTGFGMDGDMIRANAHMSCDYCTSCGYLTDWGYDKNPETWNWYVDCKNSPTLFPSTYRIYRGKSIKDGYDVHNCVDIYDHLIVHGLNCSCH